MFEFVLRLLGTPVGQIMSGGLVVIGIFHFAKLFVQAVRRNESDKPDKSKGPESTSTLDVLREIAKNTREPFNGETQNIKDILSQIAKNTEAMPFLVRDLAEVKAAQRVAHQATQDMIADSATEVKERIGQIASDIKLLKDRFPRT